MSTEETHSLNLRFYWFFLTRRRKTDSLFWLQTVFEECLMYFKWHNQEIYIKACTSNIVKRPLSRIEKSVRSSHMLILYQFRWNTLHWVTTKRTVFDYFVRGLSNAIKPLYISKNTWHLTNMLHRVYLTVTGIFNKYPYKVWYVDI